VAGVPDAAVRLGHSARARGRATLVSDHPAITTELALRVQESGINFTDPFAPQVQPLDVALRQ
jgi:hypothetical protein